MFYIVVVFLFVNRLELVGVIIPVAILSAQFEMQIYILPPSALKFVTAHPE